MEETGMAIYDKKAINKIVLEMMHDKYKESIMKNESIYFEEYDLSVGVNIVSLRDEKDRCMAEMVFTAVHPFFDEELVEICAGLGKDVKSALIMGTESFCSGVLQFILGALKCQSEETMTADIAGEKHIFRVPCVRGTFNVGDKFMGEGHDILELIYDDIPQYIGKKKAYWIKLFAGWTTDQLSCEVRINGAFMSELTNKLREKVKKTQDHSGYVSEKQFILLIQSDETYVPCPYTKSDVKKLTYDAIERIKTIDSQEKCNNVLSGIMNECKDRSLGREIVMFVPEIFCSAILGLRDSDGIIAVNVDDNSKIEMKKSQSRGFGYIDSAVYSYIREKKPQKDEAMQIMSVSSRFNGVRQAVNNGARIDELVFSDIIYLINNEYKLW